MVKVLLTLEYKKMYNACFALKIDRFHNKILQDKLDNLRVDIVHKVGLKGDYVNEPYQKHIQKAQYGLLGIPGLKRPPLRKQSWLRLLFFKSYPLL